MTGFGAGTRMERGIHCRVECSSVNRKQGEVVVQTQREFASLEPMIRNEVVKLVPRGRTVVTVTVGRPPGDGINLSGARQGYRQLAALKRELGLSGNVELSELLLLPGVLASGDASLAVDQLWPSVKKALADAVRSLLEMRSVEGANLQRAMQKQAKSLRRIMASIRKLGPGAIESYRARFRQRLERAGLPVDLSDERLLKEIAFFAERCDIDEELIRLESHLDQLDSLLAGREPVGRTLEFLVQEIFREFNTIGSKSASAAITALVVRAKTELDRLREQSANVE